jgi:purine-binding chemotaxis protein CheW
VNIQEMAQDIPPEGEHSIEGLDFITNGDQYLTFLLADEQYAVDILCVEEIRSWEDPTIIPNSPLCIKGVINMRGVIVPIVDLRIKFNVGEAIYLETTVVIVLTYQSEDESRTIGFVVDAVSDVLNAEEADIKPAPAFGGRVSQQFIEGLINSDTNVVTLLNVEHLQYVEEHKVPS